MDRPACILVVEDESIVALDLQSELQKLGYHVPATAPDGRAALQLVEDLRPDLVLMDIRLRGDLDGIEVAAMMREQFAVPVVFLTAYGDQETLRRATLTEPFGYVLKPYEESELQTAVEVALHRYRIDRDLRAANEAKTRFLAMVSHELRTPLNAIIGFSEVMQDMAPEQLAAGEARDYLDHIHAAGSHLLELINDLLDLSRIEAGQLSLNRRTFDLEAAIRSTGDALAPLVLRQGLSLQVPFGPLGTVFADPSRFRQILFNLLSNAIKFTPSGGHVRVLVTRSSKAVEVAVEDTGVGVDPIDHARIFEAFEQAGPAGERTAGTGLGLPITRRLVEAHGGYLRLESAPGRGSRFIFGIPAESPQADTSRGQCPASAASA